MPQVLILMVAGAGAYAGYKWLAREIAKHAERAARAAEEMRNRAAEAAGRPRDLGALEFDPDQKVYRPKA